MKILWLVNIMLPKIAKAQNLPYSNREGWLSGIFDMISASNEYEVAVAYPVNPSSKVPITESRDLGSGDFESRDSGSSQMKASESGLPLLSDDTCLQPSRVVVDGIKCYAFHEDLANPHIETPELKEELEAIMEDFKPDIIHIFGTEFPHALLAARAFNRPEKTLVGIQGLCHLIARDYMADIPLKVQNRVTFRDLVRRDSIQDQKNKFILRGQREKDLIRLTGNITGRTSFDKEAAGALNPSAKYFSMNETMRREFYTGRWDGINYDRHVIFLGQGDYPIKGMHFLLMAAGELRNKYPDIMIYIAGNSIIEVNSLKDRIKTPSYGKYLRELIKKNHLAGHVKTLGNLTAGEMKDRYLRSSVYVCPSYIENSPNTIAEAMLLGLPVVCSDAGGIPSIISDKEGFIFKKGDYQGLAERLEEVFHLEDEDRPELMTKMDGAYDRAHTDYDGGSNYQRLLQIYDAISGS